jgi:Ca-activated chloride channel family protein
LVVYFRLADELPARVELIPYKPAADEPGTFMLVVTPGVDLPPLAHGADYVFVLDVSGSMQGKIQTLARGVGKVLRQMSGEDRFRVVTFNNSAQELTGGWTTATTDAAQRAIQQVEALTANGSTNLYDGLQLALRGLEADRATSVVMVTDGVTNTGVVDPQAFDKLVQQVDIRFFGFLLGNSANWPLVELIANRSGGFYASVSNADDIIGQIMLAKSKVLFECLHDAELRVDGVDVFDLTDGALGKVYRGQQLVLFGRYQQGGPARLELLARRTGTDEVYTTTFDFPDVATADPEIERLWAMNRIEALERQKLLGDLPVAEATQAIEDLAVAHQIVTDETSMVALPDEVFAQYGVQRHNQARVAVETQAQSARAAVPAQPQQYRVDRQQPMFQDPAPTLNNGGNGRGGGAVDPFSLGLVVLLGGAAVAGLRQGKQRMDGN